MLSGAGLELGCGKIATMIGAFVIAMGGAVFLPSDARLS